MTAILALLTAIVVISIALIRSRKPKKIAEPVLVKRYVHPGHGWIRMTDDGYVVVGMDDFSQSLLGKISQVKLPRLLRHLDQGSAAWEVWHGNRWLKMVSPVSGWVVEKNEAVLRDPSLINLSPYGDGWLFKVKPIKLSAQLHNLLTGRAVHQWQDAVAAQFRRFFSATPALTMQDGGVLLGDLADRCSDDEWNAITNEFFLTESRKQS